MNNVVGIHSNVGEVRFCKFNVGPKVSFLSSCKCVRLIFGVGPVVVETERGGLPTRGHWQWSEATSVLSDQGCVN